jgi:hypothetical protein
MLNVAPSSRASSASTGESQRSFERARQNFSVEREDSRQDYVTAMHLFKPGNRRKHDFLRNP